LSFFKGAGSKNYPLAPSSEKYLVSWSLTSLFSTNMDRTEPRLRATCTENLRPSRHYARWLCRPGLTTAVRHSLRQTFRFCFFRMSVVISTSGKRIANVPRWFSMWAYITRALSVCRLLRPYLTKCNSGVRVSQNVLMSQNYAIKLILDQTFGRSWRFYNVVKW